MTQIFHAPRTAQASLPQARVHHRFTVDEYEQMVDTGILTKDDRVELIRGEIVEKMTFGDANTACVKRLLDLFSQSLVGRATLSIQDPVRLPESVPEPDVALLVKRADYYASGKPTAADIYLVIEVADSSLESDRDLKGPMYADAGIREYWIINLIDGCIEVYREPTAAGMYASKRVVKVGETLEVTALPGLSLKFSDVFGSA